MRYDGHDHGLTTTSWQVQLLDLRTAAVGIILAHYHTADRRRRSSVNGRV